MNKTKAIKYAQDFIIADGHIDLPFRLNKEGLLFNKNINLNYETNGNFDIPKAKRGGLNCPFMAIYIPSEKKDFINLVPYGQSTYLLLATLEMVEISISISLAMSFRIIGFIFLSSPVRKYSF